MKASKLDILLNEYSSLEIFIINLIFKNEKLLVLFITDFIVAQLSVFFITETTN